MGSRVFHFLKCKMKSYLFIILSVSLVVLMLSWTNLSIDISHKNEDSVEEMSGKRVNLSGSSAARTDARPVNTTRRGAKPKKGQKTTPAREQETPMPILSVKSFKKLPVWDFEDIYNQDAPPRPTTCAQSLRNTKDKHFRENFLPNIRLYLHKDNFNMSEWNRLSHFNNPFGFMGYKYDDVIASFKHIPKPNEPLLVPKQGGDGCIRCAVVGTSGILNGSRMGEEIDAHDYVFRMNGAITRGYEEDVGNKTSVYVHTAHSITSSLYLLKKYGYKAAPHDEGIKYVVIPEAMRDYQWLEGLLKDQKVSAGPYRNREPRQYYSGQYNESRFYVLHQDFLRYVRNRFLKSPNLNRTYWAIVRPTNGAFTLFLALHTCDTVDAYGFITEDHKKYSNYYVEKLVKTRVIFYANHDYHMEKSTWKQLHDRKIIRLYKADEPDTGTEKLK